MKKINLTEMLIFIVGTEFAGSFSALLSGGSFYFYDELRKPPFSPPGWVFPAVWGVLYALMGLSAYLIYASGAAAEKKRGALTVGAAQLLVNFTWSIVFFGAEMTGLSVGVILILLVLAVTMTVLFAGIRPVSAILNLPYLLWLVFAVYLNIAVFLLNRY